MSCLILLYTVSQFYRQLCLGYSVTWPTVPIVVKICTIISCSLQLGLHIRMCIRCLLVKQQYMAESTLANIS